MIARGLLRRRSGRAGTPCRYAGFTLLELLVVIFIVGLISTMAVLTVGSGGREKLLEREALRLGQLLGVAAQQAILQGREVGVVLERDGYRFLLAGLAEWEELKGDDLLRPRSLPEGWGLEVLEGVEGVALGAGSEQDAQQDSPGLTSDEPEKKKGKDQPKPRIIYFATGEATPFRLKLRGGRGVGSYLLEGQANGALKYTAEAPAT